MCSCSKLTCCSQWSVSEGYWQYCFWFGGENSVIFLTQRSWRVAELGFQPSLNSQFPPSDTYGGWYNGKKLKSSRHEGHIMRRWGSEGNTRKPTNLRQAYWKRSQQKNNLRTNSKRCGINKVRWKQCQETKKVSVKDCRKDSKIRNEKKMSSGFNNHWLSRNSGRGAEAEVSICGG